MESAYGWYSKAQHGTAQCYLSVGTPVIQSQTKTQSRRWLRGGDWSTDDMIGIRAEGKLQNPDFVEAKVREALAAVSTEENRRKVQVAKAKLAELQNQENELRERHRQNH